MPTKSTPEALTRAAEILEFEAETLRECHAPRDDWTGEPEAKAEHDEWLSIAAELRRLHAGMEWQPIETAPDETPVWLADADGYVWIGERRYDSDGWLWGNCYMRAYLNTERQWQSMDNEVDDDYQPVLWMHLPSAPPRAKGEKQ